MGDDLSTGAKIGIGLVILCFLIAIVLSILMVVKNITNSGANQMQSGLDQMMATTYDDYDQQIVTGTKVTSAIKLFASEPVGIVVVSTACQESGGSKGGYVYGAKLLNFDEYDAGDSKGGIVFRDTSGGALERANEGDTFWTGELVTPVDYNLNTKPISISGEETFVRDNGRFLAELIEDSTGTIIGICFTQQA